MRRALAIIGLLLAFAVPALAGAPPFGGMSAPAGCGAPCGPGSGDQYYIDPVHGNNAYNGRSPSAPWHDTTAANAYVFPPGGFGLYFTGTNTGCLTLSYATNVPAQTGKILVNSYNGPATITSNCAGSPTGGVGPKTAVITLDSISNVTVQNLSIACGGTQYGILLKDTANTLATNDTIQQNTITGCYTTGTSDYGAEIFYNAYPGLTPCAYQNLSILNNVLGGSAASSADDNGIIGFGFGQNMCDLIVQGNVIDYIGGKTGPVGSEGNGAFMIDVATAAIRFNDVHDLGGNTTTCGGSIGLGAYSDSDSVVINNNEVYYVQPISYTTGCDWDGIDLDGSSTRSTAQYNYTHNNFGAGILAYMAGVWGPNTISWNISENDAAGGSATYQTASILLTGSGSTTAVVNVVHNTVWQHLPGATTSTCPFGLGIETRVPTGGLIADNIFDMTSTGASSLCPQGSSVVSYIWGNTLTASGLTFENNDYHAASGTFQVYQWGASNYASLAAWQAVAPGGDVNSITTIPNFTSGGTGGTCGFTGTYPAGPQAVSNCPAGYFLNQGTSALIGAGIATSVDGNQDYFGNIVPNSETSGLNIGADNTAPASAQPAWAMSGVSLACNFTVGECWNGTTIVPPSAVISNQRFSQESCASATTITYAGIGQPCITSLGLALWGPVTNYIFSSYDLSNTALRWQSYTAYGGTISITGNNAVAPDGTVTAATITVSRTNGAYGSTAEQLTTYGAPAGTYGQSLWVKAATGSVGNKITLSITSSAGVSYTDVILSAVWQNVTNIATNIGSCSLASYNCNFAIGYYGASGNSQTGSTTFYAWGAQLQAGAITSPVIQTGGTTATQQIDNTIAIGQLATLLAGSAGTIYFTTSGAQPSTAATILDTNGAIFVGETASNALTMGPSPLITTPNVSSWNGQVYSAVSWGASGRVATLNGGVGATSSPVVTFSAPFHLGTLGGATAACNCYLQTINIFNSQQNINNPGTGRHYYVAAAGNDFATGLVGHPWQTPARAREQQYYGNDILSLNGGDSFSGCLLFNPSNVANSNAANPFTIGSYGTGDFTLTSTCTGQTGIIEVNGVSGVTIQDCILRVGTTSPRAGVWFTNPYVGTTQDTNIVQRCDIGGIGYVQVANDFGGEVFVTGNAGNLNNVQVLNNTLHGVNGASSRDDNGIAGFGGVPGTITNVAYNGNYIYNIGGSPNYGVSGNGMIIEAVYGGAAQFNFTTTNGYNTNTCGGPVGIETAAVVGVTINNNEVTAEQPFPATTGHVGCDWDGIDADIGSSNVIVEYNWIHNNYGEALLAFQSPSSGFTWGNNTYRFNVTENNNNNGAGGSGEFTFVNHGAGSTGATYVYNNTFFSNQVFTSAFGSTNYCDPGITIQATGAISGVIANNLINTAKCADNHFIPINSRFSFTNTALWVNNDMAPTISGTFQIYWENIAYSLATWQTLLGTDASGNIDVAPVFAGTVPYGSNCMSGAGSTTGPQNGADCPNVYMLGALSTLVGAGANLAAAPYNLPTGSFDYYGGPVPNTTTSGFNIGADNTASPSPTCSNKLDFSVACNSQYIGKGFGFF